MNGKYIEENIFKIFMIVSTVIILSTLFLILLTVVVKGLPAMNISMILKTPKGGYYLGKEGGVLNAIIGSLLLASGSTIVAFIISLPVSIFINVYTKKSSRLADVIRLFLDILWGIPSIVYGAFGFTLMIFFRLKGSLLAGIITVSLLIIPIMTRAMDEVIRMVPDSIIEASYSLGANRFETAFKIVTKQTLPGLLTAVLIAFGRAIGDAASVMFTAGFSDFIPYSLFKPAATLPLAIFFQLGSPFPEVQRRAYASAFILTIIVLIISIISRNLANKYNKHIIK